MAGKTIDNLKEIQKLVELLGKDIDRITFERLTNDIEFAKTYASELKSELNASLNVAEDLSSPFQKIQDGLTDGKTSLKDMNASMGKLKSLSQKVSDIKKGTTSTDEKGLNKLKEQLKVEKDKIASTSNTLLSRKAELEQKAKTLDISKSEYNQLKKINIALDEGVSLVNGTNEAFNDVENTLKRVNNINEEIDKKLGAAPKFAAGLDKALQKVGIPSLGIADALEKSKKEAQAAGKSTNIWAKFTINLAKNIKKAFSFANLLQGTFAGLIKGFFTSQKAIGDLAKGLGMSAGEAASMRKDFGNIAQNSDSININTMSLQKTQLAVGKALGTNAMLNKEDLETMTDLVKKTGLQHSELIGIEKLSLATGKNLDDNVEAALGGATAFASQNKLVVDNNRVLREVNKASSSLKLSLGGSVEALGEAVVKAQKFGINLEQAASISEKMLDFESSIEAELSAELLTGKNLNLERARQLALEGDIASAAEEVLKQLEGSEEFSKMNVIQQNAMAKAVGLTRDQLSSSLIEREALAAMSAEEGESALQAYERLKASKKTEEEIEKILGKKATKQLEQQSAQEKFNATVEKLKDIFVQVMDTLSPVFEVLGTIAEVIIPKIMIPFTGLTKILSGNFEQLSAMEAILGSIAGIYLTIYTRSKLIAAKEAATKALRAFSLSQQKLLNKEDQKSLLYGSRKIAQLASQAAIWALANPIKALAGIAAATAVGAAAYTYMKGDDVVSPGGSGGGYGNRTLMGPEGAIQLNNKDTVIAGTDLFKKDKPTTQGGTGGDSTNTDMTQTNALLQQLINIVQAGGTVTLDGQKVGEALKLSSFQTQ